jgi:vacuolar-type H+-ATPase subunit I/STV1
MIFGLFLQASNHIYNKDMLGLFCEFLPQFIFMFCTFGYMVILILLKLSTDWAAPGVISPPNLIQTMISMFLNVGTVLPTRQLYEGQAGLQTAFVLLALIAVPVMLFTRPCYEHYQNQQSKKRAALGLIMHTHADMPAADGHTGAGDRHAAAGGPAHAAVGLDPILPGGSRDVEAAHDKPVGDGADLDEKSPDAAAHGHGHAHSTEGLERGGASGHV